MSQELLYRDLTILERMVSCMGDYLASNDTQWLMRDEGMPKLTIGGCLMRLERLQKLPGLFAEDMRQRLEQVQTQFEGVVETSVVRFETRVHQELHARLGEWVHYLSDLSRHMVGDQAYFADKVDTRVVVAEMVQRMQQPPYQLQPQIVNELESLDKNLRSRWQPGSFIWDKVWQPAYAPDRYWYLYGAPR